MEAALRLVENSDPAVDIFPTAGTPPRTRKVMTRMQAYLAVMVLDVAAIALGTAFASVIRLGDDAHGQTRQLLMVLLPLYAGFALNAGAYSTETLANWRLGLRRALGALSLAALTIFGVGFALKLSADYSRVMIALAFVLALVLMVPGRWLGGRVARAMLRDGVIEEVVICDGAPPPAGSHRVIDARRLGLRARLDCPATLDRLARVLGHPDRVLVACPPDLRAGWTAALKGLGADVEVLLPEMDQLGVLASRRCGGSMAALVTRGPLGIRDRIQKRAFDLATVIFLLPVLLLVTAAVAIAIKLDDGGPLFFVQKRVGRGNRQFDMFKFRSMRAEASDGAGAISTARGDARITRVGRYLRSTSLDELPQLFNVLRGDMSIVGPRPHALGSTAEDKLFWAVDQRYWFRHAAKPGLTGLAQVRGFRGATATASDLVKRVQADLEYLAGWSLWRDLHILAATVKVIFHPNAF